MLTLASGAAASGLFPGGLHASLETFSVKVETPTDSPWAQS
jgi:hypothetical protein